MYEINDNLWKTSSLTNRLSFLSQPLNDTYLQCFALILISKLLNIKKNDIKFIKKNFPLIKISLNDNN